MSQENVEIVRRAILGWNDRGHESLIERLHPEVVFHPPRESMNPGPHRGPDGVREYFAWVDEIFQDQRVESVEVIEVDHDRLIAVVKYGGTTAQFDGRVETDWAWLITLSDRLATHIQTFTDKDQALEAAGLEE
jgi:ketosteroid isomerase-like protein